MTLQQVDVQCPYCGERIEIQVDSSVENQNYIEDCSVCCRPIQFEITVGEEGPEVTAVRSE